MAFLFSAANPMGRNERAKMMVVFHVQLHPCILGSPFLHQTADPSISSTVDSFK